MKTTEDKKLAFIKKAQEVHQNEDGSPKYDYSKVDYVNDSTKVCIVCPKHGEFWMTPTSHKRGYNCPKCANENRGNFKRFTLDEFIQKAQEIHKNEDGSPKYDYSKVVYENANTKVKIICPKHGEFEMSPLGHLYGGQGCPKCAGRNLTTEDIIQMFREVHEDEYDYRNVIYTKMHEKVRIICPKHGEFQQTPSKHLRGQGCPKCASEKRAEQKKIPIEEFIRRAKLIHGDRYDYPKVHYNSIIDKVCIICPIHGEFWQRAYDHLHNHGCAKCCQSHLENEMELFLKNNNIDFIQQANKSKFEWLGSLSLDFYLPKYNIAIECQGGQHFQPIAHFGGEKEFEIIRERDIRKYNLCNEKGIKIIYYSNIDDNGSRSFFQEIIHSKEKILEELNKSKTLIQC